MAIALVRRTDRGPLDLTKAVSVRPIVACLTTGLFRLMSTVGDEIGQVHVNCLQTDGALRVGANPSKRSCRHCHAYPTRQSTTDRHLPIPQICCTLPVGFRF